MRSPVSSFFSRLTRSSPTFVREDCVTRLKNICVGGAVQEVFSRGFAAFGISFRPTPKRPFVCKKKDFWHSVVSVNNNPKDLRLVHNSWGYVTCSIISLLLYAHTGYRTSAFNLINTVQDKLCGWQWRNVT